MPPSVILNVGQVYTPEIVVGETLILSVKITVLDHPLTTVTWMQQGNILSEVDERVTIRNTDMILATIGSVISTLQLNSVSIQDSGSFSFTANNAAGNNTLRFLVTVICKSLDTEFVNPSI